MGKKILVTSEKDNIGKSLFCVKLALELKKDNKKVIIVEYTGKNKSIAEYLDMDESIIYDLKDVFNKVCEIDSCAISIAENVDLLPCPRLKNKDVETDDNSFRSLMSLLSKIYNYIIVESTSVAKSISINLEGFNDLIVLNDNSMSAIREINNDFLVASKYDYIDKYIIINKFIKKGSKENKKLTAKDFEKLFNASKICYVPFDDKYSTLSSEYITTLRKDKLSECVTWLTQKVL